MVGFGCEVGAGATVGVRLMPYLVPMSPAPANCEHDKLTILRSKYVVKINDSVPSSVGDFFASAKHHRFAQENTLKSGDSASPTSCIVSTNTRWNRISTSGIIHQHILEPKRTTVCTVFSPPFHPCYNALDFIIHTPPATPRCPILKHLTALVATHSTLTKPAYRKSWNATMKGKA